METTSTSYKCYICGHPSGLRGVCGPCSLDLPQRENLREEVEDIPEYFLWPCHNCHLAAWCHWYSEACPFCMEPRQHNLEINICHPGDIEEWKDDNAMFGCYWQSKSYFINITIIIDYYYCNCGNVNKLFCVQIPFYSRKTISNCIISLSLFSDGIYSYGLNSLNLFPPLLCLNVPGSDLVHPWTKPGSRCLLWQVDRYDNINT